MHLYVEGGGDAKLLRTLCRQGFSDFLAKAGLQGHLPRIVACGSRRQAYEDFCTALAQGRDAAMLLVDSEDTVTVASAWAHLQQRPADAWPRPPGAKDDQCHLMVECMESWFLTDRGAVTRFFGQGFAASALPPVTHRIESMTRNAVFSRLAAETAKCKTKAPYDKGEHSFKLLAVIDPAKVAAASPWANRFLSAMKQAMGC